MAKKPQTEHGKARAAFIKGLISREEYILCCKEEAWVNGRTIWVPNSWGWSMVRFHKNRVQTTS